MKLINSLLFVLVTLSLVNQGFCQTVSDTLDEVNPPDSSWQLSTRLSFPRYKSSIHSGSTNRNIEVEPGNYPEFGVELNKGMVSLGFATATPFLEGNQNRGQSNVETSVQRFNVGINWQYFRLLSSYENKKGYSVDGTRRDDINNTNLGVEAHFLYPVINSNKSLFGFATNLAKIWNSDLLVRTGYVRTSLDSANLLSPLIIGLTGLYQNSIIFDVGLKNKVKMSSQFYLIADLFYGVEGLSLYRRFNSRSNLGILDSLERFGGQVGLGFEKGAHGAKIRYEGLVRQMDESSEASIDISRSFVSADYAYTF